MSVFRGLVGTFAVGALALGSLCLPAVAMADDAAPVMADYPASEFRAEAAALPDELVEALADNPGISGAEYLAQAQAGIDAAAVLESLESDGVTVLGSRLDDATLVVNVATAADASAVAATGATADLGAPSTLDFDVPDIELKAGPELRGGQAFYYQSGAGMYRCSIGFTGYAVATGARQLSTAGHCQNDGSHRSGYYTFLDQSAPGSGFSFTTKNIGKTVAGTFRLGNGYDAGVMTVSSAFTPLPEFETWGESSGSAAILDRVPAIKGATVCKSGATTGWTCGEILEVDYAQSVGGVTGKINSIVTNACMLGGDSGGPALMGNAAIGINSWGSAVHCGDPWTPQNTDGDIAGFFPLDSVKAGAASAQRQFGSKFEIGVAVGSAQVTPATSVEYDGVISGTLANGNIRHNVALFVDGGTTAYTGAVGPDGSWSVRIRGISPGDHTVRARGGFGSWSKGALSAPVAVTVEAPPLYAVLESDSPIPGAVALSQSDFGTAPVVYLTTNASTADTLAAISAASRSGGPVLLTPADALPGVVASEILRLAPERIVIAGDATAVTDALVKRLYSLAPTVVRMARPQLDAVTLSAALGAPFSLASATQVYAANGVVTPEPDTAAPVAPAVKAPQAPSAPAVVTPTAVVGTAATPVVIRSFVFMLGIERDPRIEPLRR
ncbi:trypsin-like serine protease [Glaciihabitans arcticus]|uniref:Trypsin-like serine protease n=1 Tax=Glaciihabitans arcticus TaxID=2668039 RepID=A0A4Q9GUU4_9MICO|nr:trypsin-like serine protease [Glaciihabitans arcticus]TBN55940.1 trypsin-like serine protease [Glaciihabitans arcticus]